MRSFHALRRLLVVFRFGPGLRLGNHSVRTTALMALLSMVRPPTAAAFMPQSGPARSADTAVSSLALADHAGNGLLGTRGLHSVLLEANNGFSRQDLAGSPAASIAALSTGPGPSMVSGGATAASVRDPLSLIDHGVVSKAEFRHGFPRWLDYVIAHVIARRRSSVHHEVPQLSPQWGPPFWYRQQHKTTALESWKRFWDIPGRRLAALIVSTVVMLLLDYWVLQKFCSELVQLIIWIAVAAAVLVYIALTYDLDDVGQWLSGYTYEWVFQIDNVFIIHIILQRNKVPKHLAQLVLFIFLSGQVVVRFFYYLGLAHLIRKITCLSYIAGGLLVYLGYLAAREAWSHGGAAVEPAVVCEGPLASLTGCLTWCLGGREQEEMNNDDEEKSTEAQETDEQQEKQIKQDEKRVPIHVRLVQALLCLILSDIFLGADCAIAKIEEIPGQFWNISSSVIALFGLRSSYFVLAPLLDGLTFMQLGVGCVLVFLGLELIVNSFVDLGTFTSLAVIVAIMAVTVVCSLKRFQPDSSSSSTTSTASKGTLAPALDGVIESSPDAPVASASPALGPGP